MTRRSTPLVWITVTAVLATGCAVREFRLGDAVYKSSRFGNREAIAQVELTHNGTTFIMRGYQGDQVEGLRVAVDAAVTAALRSGLGLPAPPSAPLILPEPNPIKGKEPSDP